jgi:hypothetical protein
LFPDTPDDESEVTAVVPFESTRTTAEEIVRRIGDGMPDLAGQMADRIFTEIPVYAAGAVASRDAVAENCRANTVSAFDQLTTCRLDLSTAAKTGRARAQVGLPLADLLSSFRLGYDVALEAIIEVARRPPAIPSDEIVNLTRNWFTLHNLVGDALIHAYREEAQHLLLTRERERTALVNVLLSGDIGPAMVVDVAGQLRLPIEGVFVVVAAATVLGKDPLPQADTSMSAVNVASVWQLTREALVGVLSLEKQARMPAVLEVLQHRATGPIGVSPIFTTLRRAPWGLGLAQLVLERHSGAVAVEQFRDSPMNVLVASAPGAAQETSRTIFGSLLDMPPDRRNLLLTTFSTWIESGGSTTATAATLHCHPNTIRHRLRRIEEATGKLLTHPGDSAELVAACHAWTQLPPQSWT